MDFMEGILTFISLIFVFLVVLALAYVTTKIVASSSFKKYKNRNIRILEGITIAPQKSLQLVKIGKKVVLIGISKDHIVKLDTLNEDDLNFPETELDKSLLTFEDIFNNMTKGFIKDEKSEDIEQKNK